MQWTKCSLDEDLLMEDSASSCKSENLLVYGISPIRGLQPIDLLFMEYEGGRGPFITHKEHDLLGDNDINRPYKLDDLLFAIFGMCVVRLYRILAMCLYGRW